MNTNRNQNRRSRRIAVLLCISLIGTLLLPAGAFAAGQSLAPRDKDITVTNNVGKSDTICISGLAPGETVNIYTEQGKKLSSKKVGANKMDVSFTFSQLGVEGGIFYASVISPSMTESEKTLVSVPAEAVSDEIDASQVTIVNNSGSADTIRLEDMSSRDVIKIYNAQTGGRLLKSGIVATSKSEVTLSVSQLGTGAGSVYISVTNSGKRESVRVKADFEAEGQTPILEARDVEVTNNVTGTKDVIAVTGLEKGDIVTVYNQDGKFLIKSTCSSTTGELNIQLSQLGKTAGNVFVTRKMKDLLESPRLEMTYDAEGETQDLPASSVTITNNASGTSDEIFVSNLEEGDTIKAYKSATGATVWGKATAEAGKDHVTITVIQLGTAAGSVWISRTKAGANESARTQVAYSAEGSSDMIAGEQVTITNNVNAADTIYVKGLSANDKVNVYQDGNKRVLLGSAVVASNGTSVTIAIAQLGTKGGAVYLSLVQSAKRESGLTEKEYPAEAGSQALDVISNVITVTNNASGTNDTIFVKNLEEGDTVTVYKNENHTATWGSAAVAEDRDNVTISVTQLGADAGAIWISRTNAGANESASIKVEYAAEGGSAGIDETQVTITNHVNTADTIHVKGLSENDKVNVYEDENKQVLLGSAVVSANGTSVTISVAQLGSKGGTVYLSLVQSAKRESGLTPVGYQAETVSEKLDIAGKNEVTITNHAGIADTVEVAGLVPGDVVKVYRDFDRSELLGKGSSVSGGMQTILISQLGADAGTVYLTLTESSKAESPAVTAGYEAETQSRKINEYTGYQINVVNKTGSSSTLTVKGLEDATTVKVYDKAAGGNLLGSGVTGTDGATLTVSISALPQGAGIVYVSLTTVGKLESDRTEIAHGSKTVTGAPDKEDIEVINNAGIADTITVSNLNTGDIVKIYEENSKVSEVLGSATAATGSMNAVVSISQLGKNGGVIYVSVTAAGKLESELTEVAFLKEADTKEPNKANVSVLNRSGADDEITVSGLLPGDVVKVYYDKTGDTAVGTVTADAKGSPVTIYVTDLGAADGKIYVSVKNIGKNESARTEVEYMGESKAPVENAVVVTNNPEGESDLITVYGLAANDIVKVYSTATGSQLLGFAYAGTQSDTVVISVEQLGTVTGSVYVSVTNYGKCESARVKVGYSAEL